ncbi:hypothetical protein BADSM9389_12760 [Buttiauxella agrestis]|nr:hypothetical protein BADSM9389_12760 [Buttiauxella agrestis]
MLPASALRSVPLLYTIKTEPRAYKKTGKRHGWFESKSGIPQSDKLGAKETVNG